MPNHIPPQGSGGTYIIICSGRINEAAEKDPEAKIRAVSNCAAQLVSYIELTHLGHLGPVNPEDTRAISELQHYLMDNMKTLKGTELQESIAEMFTLMDELEDKY